MATYDNPTKQDRLQSIRQMHVSKYYSQAIKTAQC